MVMAIGNPLGLGQSVTMGIISGLGRHYGVNGVHGYEDFIQTDAAINKGNSGGALVDSEGRLIGINTWIASLGGGNEGLGFAVPVNGNQVQRLLGVGTGFKPLAAECHSALVAGSGAPTVSRMPRRLLSSSLIAVLPVRGASAHGLC